MNLHTNQQLSIEWWISMHQQMYWKWRIWVDITQLCIFDCLYAILVVYCSDSWPSIERKTCTLFAFVGSMEMSILFFDFYFLYLRTLISNWCELEYAILKCIKRQKGHLRLSKHVNCSLTHYYLERNAGSCVHRAQNSEYDAITITDSAFICVRIYERKRETKIEYACRHQTRMKNDCIVIHSARCWLRRSPK